jgi:hypothetical protein
VIDPNSPSGPPAEIAQLVRERSEARSRHDWARADALKAQIEAAGWRVVDRGARSSVSPAAPANVEIDGETRYGSAASVPSLLDVPATTAWSVVIAASEQPERVSRLLSALRAHAPAGTQVVVVANDPSDAQVAALRPGAPDREPIGGIAPEVLRTSARLGYAAALNIALHRTTGELVILADGTARPTADAITPLADELADAAVAAAGAFGLWAAEEGPLRPNALDRDPVSAEDAEDPDVAADPTALEGGWLAFRRADYRELGPLDERFVTPSWLDVWWSLRLRAGIEPDWLKVSDVADDGSEGTEPEAQTNPEPGVALATPRTAVAVDLPLERDDVPWPPDRSRLNRRNMYRVLDRFGWRDDLA